MKTKHKHDWEHGWVDGKEYIKCKDEHCKKISWPSKYAGVKMQNGF
jgi:hypothetical protein